MAPKRIISLAPIDRTRVILHTFEHDWELPQGAIQFSANMTDRMGSCIYKPSSVSFRMSSARFFRHFYQDKTCSTPKTRQDDSGLRPLECLPTTPSCLGECLRPFTHHYCVLVAAFNCCILAWLISSYDRCKLKNLSTCSRIILVLTQSLHSPRLPASISADLNEVLHNSGAPSLTTTSERLLFEHNAPHNDAEIAAWDAFINERYPETGPTSATAVGPGPQSSVDAREPTDTVTTAVMERPLEGRLASGPTGQETESRCSVPKVPKGLPRKGVSGQTIAKKVPQACSHCR